jgi:integrase
MGGKPLTDAKIAAAKPDPTRRRELPDARMAGLPGALYLVVQSSGTKSWAYRYRDEAGKPRKLTLGQYPATGLASAREAARTAAARVARGDDPTRRGAAESDRISDLLDLFASEHVRAKLRETSARDALRHIEIMRALWGGKRIQAIGRPQVLALLDSEIRSGNPIQANRLLATIRRFSNWLVERAIVEQPFAAGVRAPAKERSRDRVLFDQELRRIWDSTAGLDLFDRAIRMLVLTGQRRSEVDGMRWSEIDIEKKLWSLPADRTKNGRPHFVPLSAAAIELLPPRLSGSDFVFTTNGRSRISGWSKYKARLDARAGINNWRIHDIRRTFASGLAGIGQPIHVVEKLLNHVSGSFAGVAGVYNRHSYADEMHAAIDAWAAVVCRDTGGKDG